MKSVNGNGTEKKTMRRESYAWTNSKKIRKSEANNIVRVTHSHAPGLYLRSRKHGCG